MPEAESVLVKDPLGWLTETFAQRLSEALELTTGEAPQVVWRLEDSTQPAEELLWREHKCSWGLQASFWVGASKLTVGEIGKHVLRAAGIETAEDVEIETSYLEVLGQAFSSLAQELGARLGVEVVLEESQWVSGPGEKAHLAVLELTLGAGPPQTLWLAAGLESLEAIQATREPDQAAQQATKQSLDEVPAGALAESRRQSPSVDRICRKTLELLMEVEMPVSISFGRTQLPLRDLLKLNTGSIIELDRTVNEPVEVIVNNCVIARGEVVVVEGNYGVRIHEIISREDRLRTLR